MAREKDYFYVHEDYARRLGNQRFRRGLLLGIVIMYQLANIAFKYYKKDLKAKYEAEQIKVTVEDGENGNTD